MICAAIDAGGTVQAAARNRRWPGLSSGLAFAVSGKAAWQALHGTISKTVVSRTQDHPNCQGSRFSNALPLSTSRGTETWSCTMSQVPSIFRKQPVHRTQ
jgi:hypothetical protein